MTQPKSPRQRATRTRRKPASAKASSAPPSVDADSEDWQAKLLVAQADLSRTVGGAVQALERSSAAARTRLGTTINDLNVELLQVQERAARDLPQHVEDSLANSTAVQRADDALQTLMQTAQDAAAAQADAEREARLAYQDLAEAAAAGEAEPDIRLRAEHAQQTYLAALSTASPGGDVQRQVMSAHADYENAVRAAHTATTADAHQAAREVAERTAAALSERDVPGRQQAAVAEYEESIKTLVAGTRQTLLAGQVRALQELQRAWAAVTEAAEAAAGAGRD